MHGSQFGSINITNSAAKTLLAPCAIELMSTVSGHATTELMNLLVDDLRKSRLYITIEGASLWRHGQHTPLRMHMDKSVFLPGTMPLTQGKLECPALPCDKPCHEHRWYGMQVQTGSSLPGTPAVASPSHQDALHPDIDAQAADVPSTDPAQDASQQVSAGHLSKQQSCTGSLCIVLMLSRISPTTTLQEA